MIFTNYFLSKIIIIIKTLNILTLYFDNNVVDNFNFRNEKWKLKLDQI